MASGTGMGRYRRREGVWSEGEEVANVERKEVLRSWARSSGCAIGQVSLTLGGSIASVGTHIPGVVIPAGEVDGARKGADDGGGGETKGFDDEEGVV
jgi:hypothetical protein